MIPACTELVNIAGGNVEQWFHIDTSLSDQKLYPKLPADREMATMVVHIKVQHRQQLFRTLQATVSFRIMDFVLHICKYVQCMDTHAPCSGIIVL